MVRGLQLWLWLVGYGLEIRVMVSWLGGYG